VLTRRALVRPSESPYHSVIQDAVKEIAPCP
jgi:hypothetical protein